MIAIKTVNGVRYRSRPINPENSCVGCAARYDPELCNQLNSCCYGAIWCNTEHPDTVPQHTPRVNPDTKKHNEVSLAICNYQQLAQAIQQAGGCIEILETHTVPQLLETLACNNITIKATYGN